MLKAAYAAFIVSVLWFLHVLNRSLVIMLTLPPRLDLARRNTPLQLLERLSDDVQKRFNGPRIWVKRDDLTGCATSGNKIRKLEFLIAHAIAEGCDTLITCGGVQSNHCRATALLGAQLGLNVHLLLRGREPEQADGNLLLDQLAGAEVSYYPPSKYIPELPNLFAEWQQHYANQGRKAWAIPTGASDGIGIWGYIDAARELADDFQQAGIEPDAVICASGSGGTQAGLTVGLAEALPYSTRMIGVAVSDDAAYFEQKVREDINDWQCQYGEQPELVEKLSIEINDNYVGPGYGKAGSEVFDLIRRMAVQEGLLLDPVYTGKAFLGMLTEVEKGAFAGVDDIVFVHTGGIFGLFAQKDRLF